MLRRLRSEQQGSVIVIVAIFLGVLVLLGTFAVDVGNWFTHKRHLQTQADAAALAAGGAWQINCDTATNLAIVNAARAYGGPSYEDTQPLQPAGSTTTPRYNAQIGNTPQANMHVLLNSNNFSDSGGSSFSDAQPCVTSARPDQATYDPFAPLSQQNYIADVKMTENNLPWFFNYFGGLGLIPSIHAEARVKAVTIQGERGFVPIGIQLPHIYSAYATIRWCGAGSSLSTDGSGNTISSIKLAPLTTVKTHVTLWAPDPTLFPTGVVGITKPTYTTCSGTSDFGGPDINIEVSGSPLVTPSIANCNTQYVDCFDTVLLRDWLQSSSPSAEGAPPAFHDVQLVDQNCGPDGSPWYASDLLTTPVSATTVCNFNMQANVDWGTLPTKAGYTGFAATVAAGSPGGSAAPIPASSSGTYTLTGLGTGPATTTGQGAFTTPNVSLTWSYSWATGPKNYNCTPKKPCTGTTVVHRTVATKDSPVGKVTVTDGNGNFIYSFPASSYPSSINLGVEIQDGGFVTGQRSVLRTTSSQGSEALDCNNANNGQVFQQFLNGCTPFYARNTFTPGSWEPCPAPASFPANPPAWKCVPQLPGGHGPQIVPSGFDAATKNCDGSNLTQCTQPACHNANQYVYGDPNHVYDLKDPRIIKVFLIPYAGLNGVAGNGQGSSIEVIDFAAYYVTGWSGDPCPTKPGGTDEAVPAGADAVGYFVKLLDPGAIPDPNAHCVASQTTPCIITLVR